MSSQKLIKERIVSASADSSSMNKEMRISPFGADQLLEYDQSRAQRDKNEKNDQRVLQNEQYDDYAGIPVKTKQKKKKTKVTKVFGMEGTTNGNSTKLPAINMPFSGAQSEATDRGIFSPNNADFAQPDDKNFDNAHGTHTGAFTQKMKYGKLSESSVTNSLPYAPSLADKNQNQVHKYDSARKTETGFYYGDNDHTQ